MHYEGIGKGSVNIGCLPVLFDDDGPLGLKPWMEKFCQLLERFCDVHGVEEWTVQIRRILADNNPSSSFLAPLKTIKVFSKIFWPHQKNQ